MKIKLGNWYVKRSYSPIMKGDSIVLASKRSGWLQTFLSYIRTPIIEKKSVSAKIDLVLSEFIYSSYKSLCLLDNGH